MELKFQEVELKKIQTPNFVMSPVELKDHIDFEVKRVYFITQPTGNTGAHCHKIEKEFFILQKGTCTAVIDCGHGAKEIKMFSPTSALYIGEYVWHHFRDFSEGAILCALSSTNYDAERSDYIEDYAEYKKALSEK